PAWILTGVAPNRGPATRLRDIVLAVQTEIPLVKQHLCDQLWAARGDGVQARRVDRLTGSVTPLAVRPSQSATLGHGVASVSRFFPGARDGVPPVGDGLGGGGVGATGGGQAGGVGGQHSFARG